MREKVRLGAPRATYVRPLLSGLEEPDSPFAPSYEFPAVNSIHLSERTNGTRCAFLSPIDYARHGGSYRIIPDVCVASSQATRTVTLTVNPGVRNIRTIAVDIRVTSEIILAKIILLERVRNLPEDRKSIEIVPMMPDLEAMLRKADAALLVNLSPGELKASGDFTLDLVEEWSDMTGLPYVHGFWVGREEDLEESHIEALIGAKNRGVELIDEMIGQSFADGSLSEQSMRDYFASFSYAFGEEEISSVQEFIAFAYFHGILGDAPEVNFFPSPGKA
jgi:predicted solute-binding protein